MDKRGLNDTRMQRYLGFLKLVVSLPTTHSFVVGVADDPGQRFKEYRRSRKVARHHRVHHMFVMERGLSSKMALKYEKALLTAARQDPDLEAKLDPWNHDGDGAPSGTNSRALYVVVRDRSLMSEADLRHWNQKYEGKFSVAIGSGWLDLLDAEKKRPARRAGGGTARRHMPTRSASAI
jgi:hypothetical protein